MDLAEVQVKSAWLSKINWTQAIGMVASFGALYGVDVPKDQLLGIVLGIQSLVAVLTWIQKTFFTTTITPSSAKKI